MPTVTSCVALNKLYICAITNLHQQPYQVEPYGGQRGNQVGYNKCNSTTENQDSYCQTLIANGIDGPSLS